ncbi:outer membrane protein assembly factor BamB family protein [Actinoplanes subglobosus]|uniref:PQQ-binding-like beta-propeller repeat protein n=1 Tax=Actinoplanes subglobosus TaxID=1547892 RepID=A0ABV8J2E3_9ACTN
MAGFEIVWSRRLHLRSSAAAAADGSLVVAERHSRLVRLDAGDGEVRWEQRVEDCWGTVVIAGAHCLYLSQSGVLHCLAMDDGRPLWSVRGPAFRRHVAVSGGTVFAGGWRGYHPLVGFALADGRRVPGETTGDLAPPLPLPGADAVLVADAKQALLLMTGAVEATWELPEPVLFADAGEAFRVAVDGRVVFVCGRRTVMAMVPGGAVDVLWRHSRDLRPIPPMLHDRTLWLVDDQGIAVVDLAGGTVTGVARSRARAAALIGGAPVFGFADGSLAGADGPAARRLPRVERLLSGERGLIHAIGKGHVVTVVNPSEVRR